MNQGRSRRKFTKEFKTEAVRLLGQPGMSVPKAASDLGVPENTLYRRRREFTDYAGEAFGGNGKLRPADEALAQLQRENAELRMERDILKKAAAYFARHQR